MSIFLNEENKQYNKVYTNLSAYAYAIIVSDMRMYSSYNNQNNITNFLNQIILNYADDSNVSITTSSQLKQNRLAKYLNLQGFNNAQIDQIKQQIYRAFEEEQYDLNTTYENGIQIRFRLNKETFEFLELKDDEIAKYQSLSLYLKTIFEEYALLPNYKRERVVYSKFTKTIETALIHKTCLTITCINNIKDDNSKYIKIRMKPYKICTDETGTLNYVVGLTSLLTDDFQMKEMKPGTIRLSNIKNVVETTSYNGFISKNNIEILEKIALNPSEQTNQGVKTIRVKFDEEGLRLLTVIRNNKPHDFKQISENEFEFLTTEFRAEHYFWKFQEHVQIIEPASLKKRFEEISKSILNLYK